MQKLSERVETTSVKLGKPHPPSVFSNKNDHKCPSSDICIHTSYEKHNVMASSRNKFLEIFLRESRLHAQPYIPVHE